MMRRWNMIDVYGCTDENLIFKWMIQSILVFFLGLFVKKILGLYEHNVEDDEDQEEDWKRWMKVKKMRCWGGPPLKTIDMQSDG